MNRKSLFSNHILLLYGSALLVVFKAFLWLMSSLNLSSSFYPSIFNTRSFLFRVVLEGSDVSFLM